MTVTSHEGYLWITSTDDEVGRLHLILYNVSRKIRKQKSNGNVIESSAADWFGTLWPMMKSIGGVVPRRI